jgi:CheY-like chemotaxis protein
VHSQGLDFKVEVAEETPSHIIIDAHKLRQIIINLISNAVKYTEQGFVRVSAGVLEGENSMLKICVEDSGRGIPKEQIDEIFKPFKQVQGQFNKGTGLGLTIVKNLAELMNGKIEVLSKLGRGSQFCVVLPYRIAQDTQVEQSALSRIELKPGVSPLVLIVDDVASNRNLLKEMLEPIGFRVMLAEDGIQGLERLKEASPDLILLDLNMPNLNGEEMLSILRKTPAAQTPVVAITAQGLQEHRQRAESLGFDGFVTKPFLFLDLMRVIHSVTKGKFTSTGEVEPSMTPPDVNTDIDDWFQNLPETKQKAWREALEITDLDALHTLAANSETPQAIRDAITYRDYRFLLVLDEKLQRLFEC